MRKELAAFKRICEKHNCKYENAKRFFELDGEDKKESLDRICWSMKNDFGMIIDAIELNKDEI